MTRPEHRGPAEPVEVRILAESNPDARYPYCVQGVVMKKLIEVACLECGAYRDVTGLSNDELGSCITCGYIGWAVARDVGHGDVRTAASYGSALR